MTFRSPSTDPDLLHVGAALQRAAAYALALARRTGTPCYVWQDGRVADIAAIRPQSAEVVMCADADAPGKTAPTAPAARR